MSVSGKIAVHIDLTEILSGALASRYQQHPTDTSYVVDTGNGDMQMDKVYSLSETLTATSRTLDLYGVLTDLGGSVINPAECCLVWIKNRATSVLNVLSIGNGTNPAFAKFLGAAGSILKVPAGGCVLWYAPYDTGGITITDTTAQDFKIDAGAGTVLYDIILGFRT